MAIDKVVFFGDWHQNHNYARKALYKANLEHNPDFYVHVGDFGIFRNNNYLRYVNQMLVEQNKEMWVVPGNHEDYALIAELPFDDRGLKIVGSNLFIIPRTYHWEWSGVKFTAIGGAYSVDRRYRSLNKSWWKEEEITKEDFENAVAFGPADILVSHEGPWLPSGYSTIPWTLSRTEDRASKKGRDFIVRAILETGAIMNIHGHHHKNYDRKLKNCHIYGLDCDEDYFEKNLLAISLNDLRNKLNGEN